MPERCEAIGIRRLQCCRELIVFVCLLGTQVDRRVRILPEATTLLSKLEFYHVPGENKLTGIEELG
jgi:hypothetical protein